MLGVLFRDFSDNLFNDLVVVLFILVCVNLLVEIELVVMLNGWCW